MCKERNREQCPAKMLDELKYELHDALLDAARTNSPFMHVLINMADFMSSVGHPVEERKERNKILSVQNIKDCGRCRVEELISTTKGD